MLCDILPVLKNTTFYTQVFGKRVDLILSVFTTEKVGGGAGRRFYVTEMFINLCIGSCISQTQVTLNMCSFLYFNYTSIKMLKIKSISRKHQVLYPYI